MEVEPPIVVDTPNACQSLHFFVLVTRLRERFDHRSHGIRLMAVLDDGGELDAAWVLLWA
jgi:hypothetical protein